MKPKNGNELFKMFNEILPDLNETDFELFKIQEIIIKTFRISIPKKVNTMLSHIVEHDLYLNKIFKIPFTPTDLYNLWNEVIYNGIAGCLIMSIADQENNDKWIRLGQAMVIIRDEIQWE